MTSPTRFSIGCVLAIAFSASPGCSCGSASTATTTSTNGSGTGSTTGTQLSGASGTGSSTSGSASGSTSGATSGDGGGCGLVTCASQHASCGPIGDGCGNIIQCGTCTLPETCGGGGTLSQCGGMSGCVPKTCAELHATCGPAGDGCGNLLECGGCDAGGICGGGGTPFQCGGTGSGTGSTTGSSSGGSGDGGACVPLTCADFDAGCGQIGDGCGGTAICGGCDAGGTCGGGGIDFQCGSPDAGSCTALTCADLDAGCGYIGNGCGGVVQCGTCTGSNICGGGGVPNQCGDVPPDGGVCVGLCKSQVTCSGSGTTSISGTVFAATNSANGFGDPDPLPNATVYIPNGTVEPFTPGVVCDVCGAPVSGDPLVITTSMEDGGFRLTNVPADAGFNLVVQIGRWRREVAIPPVEACTNTVLTPDQTRLPRNHTEGDIPLTAMVTGNVDSAECVLRKMGIDDSEFTTPSGGGRIQMYLSDGDAGTDNMGNQVLLSGSSAPTGVTPSETSLTDAGAALSAYDLVIFACVGAQVDRMPSEQHNLIDYTNAGGRVYTTHYSYVWLYNDPPFSATANWDTSNEGSEDNSEQIAVNTGFSTGALMGEWLQTIGASTTPDVIPLAYLRNDFTSANAPSETWLTYQPPAHHGTTPRAWPIHYTFDTPLDAGATAAECGRVVFSDFHVENQSSTFGTTFPTECGTNAPMTPQEKVLEFMLFNLSSCVTQADAGAVCAPLNCAQQGYTCGQAGDGCGGELQCGYCDAGGFCTGVPGTCNGGAGCQPRTCADYGFTCGQAGDGCGNLINCGGCDGGGTCGGGGVTGQCGSAPVGDGGSSCVPETCAAQGLACGEAGDGCGNVIPCGGCDGGTCGGGGTPGVCGSPNCTPYTCAQLGYTCGAAGNGCGGVIQCGVCDAGTCGGGFVANQCGTPSFE